MDSVAFLELLEELKDGDLRTVGKVHEVVSAVGNCPDRFSILLDAAESDHPGQALRAANAAERISREFSALLEGHEDALILMLEADSRPEVAWHAAQMLERIALTPDQASRAIPPAWNLFRHSKSRILQTCSMQLLVHLLPSPEAEALLEEAKSHPAAAVRARARLLGKSRMTAR